MGDFRSYRENRKPENRKPDSAAGPSAGLDEQAVADFAKRYDGSSEAEILSDLLGTARRGKENGTFDLGQMERFAGTLRESGMFDAAQLKRLDEVMNLLRKS